MHTPNNRRKGSVLGLAMVSACASEVPLNALFSSSMKLSCVALLQSLGSGPLMTLSLRSSSFSAGSAAMPATHRALV